MTQLGILVSARKAFCTIIAAVSMSMSLQCTLGRDVMKGGGGGGGGGVKTYSESASHYPSEDCYGLASYSDVFYHWISLLIQPRLLRSEDVFLGVMYR